MYCVGDDIDVGDDDVEDDVAVDGGGTLLPSMVCGQTHTMGAVPPHVGMVHMFCQAPDKISETVSGPPVRFEDYAPRCGVAAIHKALAMLAFVNIKFGRHMS